ncbi:MAG: hypothetical protein SFV15_01885 [Polyangiaceae bacterium]|nr:hypothetical protein [Polyangiaceae bacterium]
MLSVVAVASCSDPVEAPAEGAFRAYIAAIPGKACMRQGLVSFGDKVPSNAQSEGVPVKNGIGGAVVKCTISGNGSSYNFNVSAGDAGSSVFLQGSITNGVGTIPPGSATFASSASGDQVNVEACTIRTAPAPGAGETLRIAPGEMFAEFTCPSIHDQGDPMTTNCNVLNGLILLKNCTK